MYREQENVFILAQMVFFRHGMPMAGAGIRFSANRMPPGPVM